MPKLQSQLALFGAIDQEVTNAKNVLREGAETGADSWPCQVIELVEKFIPGTAGFGQNRWYPELVDFLSSDELRAPVRSSSAGPDFPDLPGAIAQLSEVENEPDDRDPVLARATFAAVVLEKIFRLLPDRSGRPDVLQLLDVTLRSWTQESAADASDGLQKQIDRIVDRQTWTVLAGEIVNPQFAETSTPCFGALKKVKGRYCAYITTDISSDEYTVADIAKIIEPVNWDNIFGEFFCEMTAGTSYAAGGASRISERISAECDEYFLDTALIFWKEKQSDGSIYLNYDLDPDRDQKGIRDSGLVDADSGYLVVTKKDPGAAQGVRIRTSKLERVQGLSPTATAALACLMGWGTYANQMLTGQKARQYMAYPIPPNPPIYPFHRSPSDKQAF